MIKLIREYESRKPISNPAPQYEGYTEAFVMHSEAEDILYFQCNLSFEGLDDPREAFRRQYGYDPFVIDPEALTYLEQIFFTLSGLNEAPHTSVLNQALDAENLRLKVREFIDSVCQFIDPNSPLAADPSLSVMRCRPHYLKTRAEAAWKNFQAALTLSIKHFNQTARTYDFYKDLAVGIINSILGAAIPFFPLAEAGFIVRSVVSGIGGYVTGESINVVENVIGLDDWLDEKINEWSGVSATVEQIITDITNSPIVLQKVDEKICEIIQDAAGYFAQRGTRGATSCPDYMPGLLSRLMDSAKVHSCQSFSQVQQIASDHANRCGS